MINYEDIANSRSQSKSHISDSLSISNHSEEFKLPEIVSNQMGQASAGFGVNEIEVPDNYKIEPNSRVRIRRSMTIDESNERTVNKTMNVSEDVDLIEPEEEEKVNIIHSREVSSLKQK